MKLNGETLGTVSSAPQVKTAQYEGLYYPLAVDPDLAVISAPQAWAAAGGSSATAGDGVKVAILDTGIDVTHPCFSDGGYPAQKQLGDTAFTNNKVIVAKVFNNKTPSRGFTAEALQEHGTHVAGTVACNSGTAATVDGAPITHGISGVAPRALLGNYNIFPGQVANARSEDILNALDAEFEHGDDGVWRPVRSFQSESCFDTSPIWLSVNPRSFNSRIASTASDEPLATSCRKASSFKPAWWRAISSSCLGSGAALSFSSASKALFTTKPSVSFRRVWRSGPSSRAEILPATSAAVARTRQRGSANAFFSAASNSGRVGWHASKLTTSNIRTLPNSLSACRCANFPKAGMPTYPASRPIPKVSRAAIHPPRYLTLSRRIILG